MTDYRYSNISGVRACLSGRSGVAWRWVYTLCVLIGLAATLSARTPALPADWCAATHYAGAEQDVYLVEDLHWSLAVSTEQPLGLYAARARLVCPTPTGYRYVRLEGADWQSVSAAAPTKAAPLQIDRLELQLEATEWTIYGYAQAGTTVSWDSLKVNKRSEKQDRYIFSTERFRIEAGKKSITLEGFRMQPRLSARQFPRQATEKAARLGLSVRRVEVYGTDVSDWLQKKNYRSDSTIVRDAALTVDTYEYLPDNPSIKRLPHQLLADLAPGVDFGVMMLSNCRVDVTFNHKGRRSGQISFGQIHGRITNIQNGRYDVPVDLRVDIAALLYDVTPLTLSFRMPGGTVDGHFWANGKLGAMDMRDVNQTLVTEGNMRVRRGQLDSMVFLVSANDTLATGNVYAFFHGLDVRKLRGFKSDQPRKLFSSFMDLLGIPKNNPDGKELRIGYISWPRDPEQSFFSYLWNAIRTGLLSIMTPNFLLPDEQESRKTQDF